MGTAAGPRIVVIGAGCGGLAFAIGLARKYGYQNYTIYERAADVGGTWRDHVYPGCSSDVAIHFYSLSTDLKYDWKGTHGYQAEIYAYWKELAVKYNLMPHIAFNTRVVSAEWLELEQKYKIIIEDVISGRQEESSAEILVSAAGPIDIPNLPNIPGIETFKGTTFHSSRWDTKCDMRGKRVGVIGNGASATQLVPEISKDPGVEVINFCRTPNWISNPRRFQYTKKQIWLFQHIPFYARFFRWLLFVRYELGYWSVFSNRFLHPILRKVFIKYMKSVSPVEYHDNIIPQYTIGCRRIVIDTDYLSAFHRPNLTMNWDGLDSITPEGVVTGQGAFIPLDILVFATGYIVNHFPFPLNGQKETINEYYDAHEGPYGYLGTTIPTFPNAFLLVGPNTLTGNTSVIFYEECQVSYILQLIKPLLERKLTSISPTIQATDAYNQTLQSRLSRSVFYDCVSWYRKGQWGKVTSIFPGSGTLFWWWLRKPIWSDFTARPEEAWSSFRRRRKLGSVANLLAIACLCLFIVFRSRPQLANIFAR